MQNKSHEASTSIEGKRIRGTTVSGTLLAILLLFIFVGYQSSCNNAGSALAISAALLATGYLMGLLFAVPKSVAVSQPTSTVTVTGSDHADRLNQSPVSVNTNFEQISDWLTKIIVGVGLVEAKNIYDSGAIGAHQIGEAVICSSATRPTGGDILGAAILVGFPTLGLILGFFSVRLYISRAIHDADSAVNEPRQSAWQESALLVASTSNTSNRFGGSAEQAFTLPNATVKQTLAQPLSPLSTAEQKVAWGLASLSEGNIQDSAAAIQSARNDVGDRPDVALAYVEFLYASSKLPDYAKIITVLEGARRQLDSTISIDIRRRVMEELINAYLYSAAPSGYQAALRLLDEYLAGDGINRGDAYVFASAAHGQKFAWLIDHDASNANTELSLIVDCAQKAISLGGDSMKQWLRSLAKGSGSDDDLVQAANSSEQLRSLLNI